MPTAESVGPRPSPFELTVRELPGLVARAAVLATLVALPWMFGGADASRWAWPAVLLGLACWPFAAGRIALPTAVLPLVAGLALGAAQLAPVPVGVLGIASPRAADVWPTTAAAIAATAGDLASETPSLGGVPFAFPVSLVPANTRLTLTWLLLATATFLLGTRYFRERTWLVLLCGAATATGVAVTLFGVAQALRGGGHVLGRPMPGGTPFGPFVNKNNAAGFLLVCLAAAVLMLIWTFRRWHVGPEPDELGEADTAEIKKLRTMLDGSGRGWRDLLLDLVNDVKPAHLVALAAAGLVTAGVLCTLSRGGAVALAAALAALGLAAWRWGADRRWLRLAIPVGAVALFLVVWIGMDRRVADRLASWRTGLTQTDGRLPLWAAAARALPDHWRLGGGLGSFGSVYPAYQDRPTRFRYPHAENDYVEAAIDAGIPGLALLLALGALMAVVMATLARGDRSDDEWRGVAATACLLLVVGQGVHATVDFGWYMPANFFLLALLAGALAGRAAELSASWFVALPVGVARCVWPVALALGVWAWREAAVAEAADPVVRAGNAVGVEVERFAADWSRADRTAKQVEAAVAKAVAMSEASRQRLTTVVGYRPADAEAHRQLSARWIESYRLGAFARLRAAWPKTAAATLWQATLPGEATAKAFAGDAAKLAALRADADVAAALRPALAHALVSLRHNPLQPDMAERAAELAFVAGPPEGDPAWTELVRRLAPARSDLLYPAGLVDYLANREAGWILAWRRALELGDDRRAKIATFAVARIGVARTLDEVLPPSPVLLARLANDLYPDRSGLNARQPFLAKARVAMGTAALPEDERLWTEALIAAGANDLQAAAAKLREAVALRPRDADWRRDLALVLEGVGDASGALEEYRRLRVLQPNDYRWPQAIQRLDRRP